MLTLIKNAKIVNEGEVYKADVLIENQKIKKIDLEIKIDAEQVINAEGLYLLPGVIDDQVHFREPGLTHKGSIYTESKAAVAGGITSFMEMPNTNPQALTQKILEDKYEIAAKTSFLSPLFSSASRAATCIGATDSATCRAKSLSVKSAVLK